MEGLLDVQFYYNNVGISKIKTLIGCPNNVFNCHDVFIEYPIS